MRAKDGAVKETLLPAGFGNRELSIQPNSHWELMLTGLDQAVRSGSLSGSDIVGVMSTALPAVFKTLAGMVKVGKLFSLGLKSSGLARALARLSRPPVEVLFASVSVRVS